ncbi:ATP-binding protein [Ureibacillus manganicus]|uniref:ATP-binding protein n=1 Tax=Ureibacillus manganicus TaxID=1266064 RepID=UPI00068C5D70|nr:DUF87 domain-containing protein [Ureibacillus manganicus]
MSRRYRIILLTCTFVLLQVVGLIIEGNFINLFSSFWYTSGFVLLILMSLVDQPFFSKDSNIFMNAITAIMALLLVPIENHNFVYYFFIVYTFYLVISSYILMIMRSKELKEENKFIQFIARFNRIIGKPDAIFSAFFLWGAAIQYTTSSGKFNALLLFWVIFMLLNLPELSKVIEKLFEKTNIKRLGIGKIFGVQSKNVFLVKVVGNYENFELFSYVEMKYSVDNKIYRGFICEIMLLDNEQWLKVIANEDINKHFHNRNIIDSYTQDTVYKIDSPQFDHLLHKFVGLVTEGTVISKLRFIYNSIIEIEEGSLLEVGINGKKIIYQIVQGKVEIEQLANRNQSGYVLGEAIQLGMWNNQKSQFDKYGWIPEINTPVYISSPIDEVILDKDELIVGYLPDSNYPVIINKTLAITHHTAIIGVTGTGKSVFTRNLIRELLNDDVKVICIDFTGEYKNKFTDLNPVNIINQNEVETIYEYIDKIEVEEAKFANQRNNDALKEWKSQMHQIMKQSIDAFLRDDTNKITIIELPEVYNTSGVMYYTMAFIRTLFSIAKNNSYNKKISLVLEEAHTIIPEWNFAGSSDKNTQAVINSIAQIALQGRKYNIGLLVIAQRTANVSKTILTQCNSIISFQEFDKTSLDYLANYFGNEIVESVNKLKFRQAIGAGKAFKSNVPIIFEVPEINEDIYLNVEKTVDDFELIGSIR